MLWELSPEKEAYCQEINWRCALTFKALNSFEMPYPIKEFILSRTPGREASSTVPASPRTRSTRSWTPPRLIKGANSHYNLLICLDNSKS